MIYIVSCTLVSDIETNTSYFNYRLSNSEVVSSSCPLEFEVIDGKDVLKNTKTRTP